VSTPVLAGSLLNKAPKGSQDYVAEYQKRLASLPGGVAQKTSTQTRREKMALVLSQPDGITRLGVGMIGPIQLKLRYQGLIRNVLVEDPIPPGVTAEYEVVDDLGQAYIMSGHEGEVRITPFEGKRVRVEFFRIASRPAIRKEDLTQMRVDMVEQAQDETKQAILKQEDSRLISLLMAAVTDYASRPDNPTPGAQNVTVASGGITPASLYAAVTMTDLREIESSRLLVSMTEFRDFYLFDQNQTGWAMKDRVVAGQKITTFGEFQIQRSIVVPTGKAFLLPEPNFLGVFPIQYSLDVEEDNKVEAFWRGWVFDEMVSMAILNPRGIATITKSTYLG